MKESRKKWLKTLMGREYRRNAQQRYRQRKAEGKRKIQALIDSH